MEQLHALIGTQGQDISAGQMALRAILIFLLGVIIVRFAATRAFGKSSPLDIIFAVVVGSNLSRAMTGSAPFIPTLVATIVLVALHGLLAKASAKWSWLSALTKGRSVVLVQDGVINRERMRRAGIGEGDLRMALRSEGHEGLEEVHTLSLERNGDITIISR